ncbi:spore cortex-lytic enzyme [Marinicrinis sediminis]|uniref:Spore cortex-lytic enzyme n=1 Tax=Marinicrinis sediminis TaxID=1652465 RepID=A0ABW5R5L4_9BACL
MKYRLIWSTCLILVVLFSALQFKLHTQSNETFSKNEMAYGAQGKDVRELQGRLHFLGFYDGNVDGDFGTATLQSVKTFQSEFGLEVDGIAGDRTKLKLWEATKQWKPGHNPNKQAPDQTQQQGGDAQNLQPAAQGLSQNDLKLMANAVYGEARGESYEGQIAVAAVILNRIRSKSFPNTVSGVIFQPGAFTAVADGQIWLTPNEKAKRAVQDALNGMDPTGGCIYYFNPDTATSKWIWSRPQVKRIGKHIFCM